MILAAGLSPAWQHILVFDNLHVGEVNRASEVYWCPAGKVTNVAIAAHHLESPCKVLTCVGGP